MPGKDLSLSLLFHPCAKPDAFLCSINDVKVRNTFDQRARNMITSAEGSLRHKISGQGLAFIVGGGSVVQKNLEVGEVLVVDVASIVALSGTVNFQAKYNGQMRRAVFDLSASFGFCLFYYS
ncbi:PREDICTED: uncharacterized protein LOC109208961 isoform X1 [Nicotiana attenuata]|uniref:uncharacterized protein LOC109208961 isoform X1 n=1 Tax=Nicotiana attenuata TaxID=49451 RepID=UPI000904EFBA|nr:PREDICTED: uncharacterized protein LOC109208961 isoform X1 [Nicotiana attenuata]